ncbi:MAG: DUF839 domain-containing protein [Fimbriimonadaceae bacterium]|nr:DUF839 domain-containing protein [Chitinophagales bacterium]
MGWIVEVDPFTTTAIKKYYSMGNFSHEDILCMSDGKTVYLTEDNSPCCLYKFIADEKNNYTTGQLYAYKQNANAAGGSWLALPMQLDSLLITHDIAFRYGATTFSRLEGICKNADETKIYFSETGNDACNYIYALFYGAMPAKQIQYLDTIYGSPADGIYSDYYGRVWEFDISTKACKPLIEGGTAADGKTNFSNPDNLAFVQYGTKREFLFMQEDLNGISFGRLPPHIISGADIIPEIYCLDLSKEDVTINDLQRFAIGPKGSETCGITFSNDGNTVFMNVMHPNVYNSFPFNNSVTLAVTGLRDYLLSEVTNISDVQSTTFSIYPNPATRELHFSKIADVVLYDVNGKLMLMKENVRSIDVSRLEKGVYFIDAVEYGIYKIIFQ